MRQCSDTWESVRWVSRGGLGGVLVGLKGRSDDSQS